MYWDRDGLEGAFMLTDKKGDRINWSFDNFDSTIIFLLSDQSNDGYYKNLKNIYAVFLKEVMSNFKGDKDLQNELGGPLSGNQLQSLKNQIFTQFANFITNSGTNELGINAREREYLFQGLDDLAKQGNNFIANLLIEPYGRRTAEQAFLAPTQWETAKRFSPIRYGFRQKYNEINIYGINVEITGKVLGIEWAEINQYNGFNYDPDYSVSQKYLLGGLGSGELQSVSIVKTINEILNDEMLSWKAKKVAIQKAASGLASISFYQGKGYNFAPDEKNSGWIGGIAGLTSNMAGGSLNFVKYSRLGKPKINYSSGNFDEANREINRMLESYKGSFLTGNGDLLFGTVGFFWWGNPLPRGNHE
jgi:hypothetical protein